MHVTASAGGGASAPWLADLPTSVWSSVQEHMDLKDWVRAAGTCKASWAVHLRALKTFPAERQDISGWQFLLKRCRGATSINLSLRKQDVANNLSLALKLQPTPVELPSVRELHLSGCGADAFLTVAALCPNIQVLDFYTWDALPQLPVAPHLRHLILRSKDLHTLVDKLQELRSLETLSLQVYDTWLEPHSPCHAALVNLAHLPRLKHLRYTDFVPADTKVPGGCQLHFCINLHLLTAIDDMIGRMMGINASWLGFSRDHSYVHLGSLCLNFPKAFEDTDLRDLQAAVRKAPNLEYVRLKILHLGDYKNGFDIFDVFPHVKQVVLISTGGCWLSGYASSGQASKNLSVTCEDGLNLHLPDLLDFMRGLCSFSLQCSRLSGVTPERLVNTAAAVGRRAVIENLPEKGACRVHTQCSLQQKQSFDRLMLCGCHTCARCLSRDGKLSKG